ncbi:MAG: hypothetical protein INQ03_23485 [Candidatus Heimdallarchaeota archaeon]|nr:hypothetical protein [Candidatus Heimdallarchaeota archaeon]
MAKFLSKAYVEKVDESIGELQTIMFDLKKLAGSDGKITDDEKELLNTIAEALEQYYELLEEVVEDSMIDENEYKQMKEYEKKLFSIAEKKALEDDNLSEDEKNILKMLRDLLDEIGTLELQ